MPATIPPTGMVPAPAIAVVIPPAIAVGRIPMPPAIGMAMPTMSSQVSPQLVAVAMQFSSVPTNPSPIPANFRRHSSLKGSPGMGAITRSICVSHVSKCQGPDETCADDQHQFFGIHHAPPCLFRRPAMIIVYAQYRRKTTAAVTAETYEKLRGSSIIFRNNCLLPP